MVTVIDANNMALCAIVILGMQFLFYIISTVFKVNLLTCTWGINFVVIALLTFFLPQTYAPRQIAITALMLTYGVRLSLYLFYRLAVTSKEDCWWDGSIGSILIMALIWFGRAGLVFNTCLPMIFVNSEKYGNDTDFGALDIAGTVLSCIGLIIETVADTQKSYFRNNPQNKGKVCDIGLWKWSRHPNYFGDIAIWCGLFVIACGVIQGGEWACFLSPLLMTFTFLTSIIPVQERSADKRYKGLESYREYKAQTSPLIPIPPMLYRGIPDIVKRSICCEHRCYNKSDSNGCQGDTQVKVTDKSNIVEA